MISNSSMDTAHWPQETVVKPIKERVTNSCSTNLEGKARPRKEQALNCPRCNSTNTKFCYYNNYSLTQPRYFCKTCRRYWTEGGSLRNIPVGGGSRKNKRSSTTSSKKLPDLVTPPSRSSLPSPKISQESQDLNLAFPHQDHQGIRGFSKLIQIPSSLDKNQISSSSTSTSTSQLSALGLLTGMSSRGLINSLMPMPHVQDPNNTSTVYTSGFPHLQDFKPTLNFSFHGLGNGYASDLQESTSGRLVFPFEDLKQVSSTTTTTSDIEHDREHGNSAGYWTGMLGGGSW